MLKPSSFFFLNGTVLTFILSFKAIYQAKMSFTRSKIKDLLLFSVLYRYELNIFRGFGQNKHFEDVSSGSGMVCLFFKLVNGKSNRSSPGPQVGDYFLYLCSY